MSEQKKDKLIKGDTARKPQQKKDELPFAESHSQDADRHRKIKHPVSDK